MLDDTSDYPGRRTVFTARAEPTLKNTESQAACPEAIRELTASGVPFLLAGECPSALLRI